MSASPNASSAEVRAFLRARRRKPASMLDRYVTVFALIMAAAVLGRPISALIANLTQQSDTAQAGAGLALGVLALVGFVAAARTAGPVALPAADAAWLVLSPLDRRGVLGRTARILLFLAVAFGLVLGLGLVTVFGTPDQLIWALVLGVSASVGGMAMAALSQASHAWHAWVTAGLVVLALAAVLAATALWRTLPTGPVLPVSSLLAALVLVRQAWRNLARIPLPDLLRASTRAGHAASAAFALDPGALTWITEDNYWRARTLRTRRWPRVNAPLALAWADWRRVARRPGRLVLLFAAAALPALLARAGAAPLLVGVSVLGGALAVAANGTAGARRDADNPSLSRLLGIGHRAALTARALLPAALAAAWATTALLGLTATGTFEHRAAPQAGAVAQTGAEVQAGTATQAEVAETWWAFGVVCAPAIAAGALRMARRRPVDHSMPVIDTPGGAIPTGPVMWAATGVDLAVLGSIPALAAFTQSTNLGIFLAGQAVLGLVILAAYILQSRPST